MFEAIDLDYNFLLPYLQIGVELQTSLFFVEPFIQYQIDPIFFDDINEINSSDIDNAISNAGIVTGVSFSFQL